MLSLSTRKIIAMGRNPLSLALLKCLTVGGAEVILVENPKDLSLDKRTDHPACVIVDSMLPNSEQWLRMFKFGHYNISSVYHNDFCGLGTAVIGLLPSKANGGSERLSPLEGLRLRSDAELYYPYSLEDIMDTVEKTLKERAERPDLRTLIVDYSPEMKTQNEAKNLMKDMLDSCGLSENECYAFHCSVIEALDNVRRHETQDISSQKAANVLKTPNEEYRMVPVNNRACLWFDADKKQVVISVSSNSWKRANCLEDIFGRVVHEPATYTVKRRSQEGRPGGLGFHIMRTGSDELRYESSRGAICLIKRIHG